MIPDLIDKPLMPGSWVSKYKQPYNPAWMDYCDPYHCGDYHKRACGLNRDNMRFEWFQSVCHLILNNKCSTYKGTLKYQPVDTKFCYMYVMYLRNGRQKCDDTSLEADVYYLID
ncbi:uncharacterized protein LOC114246669 [Bombyx mandarina]|uniref:Uncharacterized protein n=2 Tax=Bombyx TaxID=7090 RepID=A0A8R2C9S4_BOMMO|nr:uncharacterized protein LOC105842914 [Bombyx mori]XP_028035133.1 uncharacterized protein LOC114246669 [Bombyx mandarina]